MPMLPTRPTPLNEHFTIGQALSADDQTFDSLYLSADKILKVPKRLAPVYRAMCISRSNGPRRRKQFMELMDKAEQGTDPRRVLEGMISTQYSADVADWEYAVDVPIHKSPEAIFNEELSRLSTVCTIPEVTFHAVNTPESLYLSGNKFCVSENTAEIYYLDYLAAIHREVFPGRLHLLETLEGVSQVDLDAACLAASVDRARPAYSAYLKHMMCVFLHDALCLDIDARIQAFYLHLSSTGYPVSIASRYAMAFTTDWGRWELACAKYLQKMG